MAHKAFEYIMTIGKRDQNLQSNQEDSNAMCFQISEVTKRSHDFFHMFISIKLLMIL